MKEVDYIVVGQGLAGTLAAHFLLKADQKIIVFDKDHQESATKVAAGLINPITGRRYVKSWKIDDLLPFAKSTYRELESEFKLPLLHNLPILRSFASVKEENDWLLRSEDLRYQNYLKEQSELGEYNGKIHPAYGYGEVLRGCQVSIGKLIQVYRQKLIDDNVLINQQFDYRDLHIDQPLKYLDWQPKGVIFCEGALAWKNPFFNYLPFHGDQGEALVVKIPNAHFSKALKQKVFIIPLETEDLYWVGATYKKKTRASIPTEEGRSYLEQELNRLLKIPYEIVEHRAAVRPTVKDRRPFVGKHPEFKGLYLFNGLGTKGTSLGPYWADKLVEFLIKEETLDSEVDINRFASYFKEERI